MIINLKPNKISRKFHHSFCFNFINNYNFYKHVNIYLIRKEIVTVLIVINLKWRFFNIFIIIFFSTLHLCKY